MENSEIYNNLIQVRKISQLTNLSDFNGYDDEDILFVIAAKDKILGKWNNFSVNKRVLFDILSNINLTAIEEEAQALRNWLQLLQSELSKYDSLVLAIESLNDKFDEYYTRLYIDTLMNNYYTKEECDDKFQPKGNYLTKHHDTNSTAYKINIPNNKVITSLSFDNYGHVIDISYDDLPTVDAIIPTKLTVNNAGFSPVKIYITDNKPTWNFGTVTVTYSNGTSKTVTNYISETPIINNIIEGVNSYSVSYSYTENGVTLNTTVTSSFTVGVLNSINISNYGLEKTTFDITDTLPAWRNGTVTANYTQGLSSKTISSSNYNITTFTSSNSNVLKIIGTTTGTATSNTVQIVGAGTATLTRKYTYTEGGKEVSKSVSQTITINKSEEYWIYVGEHELTASDTTGVNPDSSSSTNYYYYIGWQDDEGIGTLDLENTNPSFTSSTEKITANSLDEIRSVLNETVTLPEKDNDNLVIVVPTTIANEISSIKTPLNFNVSYFKLIPSGDYTCIWIGDVSLNEIIITF